MLKERLAGLAKKMFATAVCLGAAAFVFANVAMTGNAATKGKVIANAAKVRAQANTTSDQVGSVPKDGEVVILEEVNGADGKVWYKVSFDGDKTGYIRSDLMTKFEDESAPSESAPGSNLAPGVTAVNPVPAKVSGAQVRVRSSASTAGDIVTTLEKDSVVTVLGTATDSTGKIWYQITYNDVNGFVRNDFVTLQGDLTAPEQQPVVDDPVDDPVIDEPDVDPAPVDPIIEKKAMETQLEDDIWYLYDYNQGKKYSIPELFDAAEKNGELYNNSLATMKKMKMWLGILLAITFVSVIGATMVIMKFKDLKDAVEFGKTERETLEKRMNQKLKNRQQSAEKTHAQGTGTPAGVKKPVGTQGKTAAPQKRTVTDVSGRPASQGKPQANVQQRPAKPVVKEKVQFNEQLKDDSTIVMPAIPKTALNDVKGEAPVKKAEEKVAVAPKKEAANVEKPVEKTEAKPKQVKPKNFLEDDDDFEFEFLNWDGDK